MSSKGIFKEESVLQLVPSLVILVQSISILVKLLHPRKHSVSKIVTLLAPVIVVKFVHPLKQYKGIVVIKGFMSNLGKLEQFAKVAFVPKDVK